VKLLTIEKDLLMAKITDAPRAGLISLRLSGALPETYFCSNLDEYEAVMAALLADDGMSPPDRADLVAGSVEPEETFEEYLERHGAA
jgi:hypothetical protein